MHMKNDSGAMPPASDWTDPDDAPELTEAFFADAEFYKGDTFVRRGPGRPVSGNAKELVSLRLDREVLAKLREGGPGWQTRVNEMLRKALADAVVIGMNQPVIFDRTVSEHQTDLSSFKTQVADLQPLGADTGE